MAAAAGKGCCGKMAELGGKMAGLGGMVAGLGAMMAGLGGMVASAFQMFPFPQRCLSPVLHRPALDQVLAVCRAAG